MPSGDGMRKKDPDFMLEFLKGLEDCLLIVEGKKDAKSLNTLGLKNILAINGKPLVSVTRRIADLRENHRYSDIIILTDFDCEGRRIAAELDRLLRAHSIHSNQRVRHRILSFGFTRIEEISMDSLIKLKEKGSDDNVKTSSNINKIRDKGLDKGERSRGEA